MKLSDDVMIPSDLINNWSPTATPMRVMFEL